MTTKPAPPTAAEALRIARESLGHDAKMTPGEWRPDVGIAEDPYGTDDLAFARGPMLHRCELGADRWKRQSRADAAGIAHARAALPALARFVEALLDSPHPDEVCPGLGSFADTSTIGYVNVHGCCVRPIAARAIAVEILLATDEAESKEGR